jgi:hypothetical protein
MKNKMTPREFKNNNAGQIAASVWPRIGIIILVTLGGALWLYIIGPMPVVRISSPLHEKVSFWYMIGAFPFLGMLCADLAILFISYKWHNKFLELGISIVLLVYLSSLRLIVKIPISGHSMLLGYLILRRVFIKFPSRKERILELLCSSTVLGMIIYYKLVLWNDPISLLSGLFLSGVLISISLLILGTTKDARGNYY